MFQLLMEAINHAVPIMNPIMLMLLLAAKNRTHTPHEHSVYLLTPLALGHLVSIEEDIPPLIIPLPDTLVSVIVKHSMSKSTDYLQTDRANLLLAICTTV